MQQDHPERAAFEAWAAAHNYNTHRDDSDKYRDYHRATTRFAWEAWQARAEAASGGGGVEPAGTTGRNPFGEVLREWATSYPRMDIYAKPGTMVMLDCRGGYDGEKKSALRNMVMRGVYEVEETTVHSSSSTVKLVGIDGEYNTVLFSEGPLFAAPVLTSMERGWQPIETAPRGSGEDGPNMVTHPAYIAPPKLLLWTEDGPEVGYYDWYYHPGYGSGAEPGIPAWRASSDGGPIYNPTHWMPLPSAPGQDSGSVHQTAQSSQAPMEGDARQAAGADFAPGAVVVDGMSPQRGEAIITKMLDEGFEYVLLKPHHLGPRHGIEFGGTAIDTSRWSVVRWLSASPSKGAKP